MIRAALFLAIISFCYLAPLRGQPLKLPNDEVTVATIDLPDSWEPEEITNGFAGTSPDRAVYLAVVAVGKNKGMQAQLDETFNMLKEQQVALDQSSRSEGKLKIAGLEANEITYRGKDEDGPAAVRITLIPLKDKVVVITCWISTDEEKTHEEEVGKILESLKVES